MVKIFPIFVTFLENMNFTGPNQHLNLLSGLYIIDMQIKSTTTKLTYTKYIHSFPYSKQILNWIFIKIIYRDPLGAVFILHKGKGGGGGGG